MTVSFAGTKQWQHGGRWACELLLGSEHFFSIDFPSLLMSLLRFPYPCLSTLRIDFTEIPETGVNANYNTSRLFMDCRFLVYCLFVFALLE